MTAGSKPNGKTASGVRLEAVTKSFGSVHAVNQLSLDIQPGEFFSLLGPSGCGKSTLLRLVAGFEQPDEGRIFIGEGDVTHLIPQRRPTAMVFQNYALFPTMTVGENVAYGLEVHRVARASIKERVDSALSRVELSGLTDKPVTQLSGGQQQRVALARALAVQPGVLLFDEPLSNLDVALREQTRRELQVLQRRLGTTSVYVTHDQQEALALSDRIAVMRAGEIKQVGLPETMYHAPETAFVAQFLGGSNIVTDRGLMRRITGQKDGPDGQVLSVRPEHLFPDSSGVVVGKVISRQFLGTYQECWVDVEGVMLRAWLEPGVAVTDPLSLSVRQYRWVTDDLNDPS